uniref:Membrane palmitoylated protein 4 n=1 Tax=Sinocyclocheilus anshuiensis TaxID=1608454 RepID=A0A671KB18_9TELE
MRPDVETDPGSAPLEMGDKGMMLHIANFGSLTQILAHVIAEVRGSVNKDVNGAELLYSLLNAPWLQSQLKVESILHTPTNSQGSSPPVRVHLLFFSAAIQNPSNEARELYALLSHPHLQGATIRRDDVTGEIYIARVIHGGLADRSGLLHAGDRLVEVNGHPVFGVEPEQIIQILVSTHTVYSPIICWSTAWYSVTLQKELWWSQPYHPHTCAILSYKSVFFPHNSGFRRSLRLCRQPRGQAFGTSQFCTLRCPTNCYSSLAKPYEEVVRYQHHPEHPHRLIALLGPSGLGVNELRRRLIEINPKVYQGAVPHTTRPPKCHEESGREYHFISREQFDTMVCNHRFIEFGELRGHLYGTSVDAVKDVLASGKICVIDIEPYALESVRTAELRAHVIFIKPPTVEQMKCTRMNSHIITSDYTSQPFKDEDFQEIEDAGRNMEQHYCQFFDHVIVNDGLQAACVQLLTAVRRAQDEPQWVPAAWIRPTDQS